MSFRRSRNRGNSLRPINRIKHVTDVQVGATAGTTTDTNIINTVDSPTIASTNQVAKGSTINGIFVSLEVVATSSAALSNCYMIILKNPGGNLTMPAPNVVGSNDNKRYVFHQEMVMLQQQTNSNPRSLFKGVIAIPKGYRRMTSGDLITIRVLAPGVNINFCLQTHYNEYR